jgi:predicted dienelactone hydrolase
VADNRFLLNELERVNRDPASPFFQKLDTTNVGALGHSFGGAVSAQTCLDDSRVKSALDIDGSLFGDVRKQGLQKPLMLIEEDLQTYPNRGIMSNADRINQALDVRDRRVMQMHGAYHISLHGSTHSSFTDRSLFSPFKSLSGEGSLPKTLEYSLVRLYVLAFFQKTLLDSDPSILTNKPPVPEVTFELIPPS